MQARMALRALARRALEVRGRFRLSGVWGTLRSYES
jgi:hypothetical protein